MYFQASSMLAAMRASVTLADVRLLFQGAWVEVINLTTPPPSCSSSPFVVDFTGDSDSSNDASAPVASTSAAPATAVASSSTAVTAPDTLVNDTKPEMDEETHKKDN